MVIARQELPYSFDVRSSKLRIKDATSDQTQQANIGLSSNFRGGAKYPGPIANPSPTSSTQLATGPHTEGIKRQMRREKMAGENLDYEGARQRTSGHVSSIGEPEQQIPSDVYRLPSAIPVFHPSSVPKASLLVQEARPVRGSSGGEYGDSTEGGQGSVVTTRSEGSSLRINAPCTLPASRAGAPYTSEKSRGQPY